MSRILGFEAAQRAYKNMEPPEDVEHCDHGDCDECRECSAAIAQDQADAYAEEQWEERRIRRITANRGGCTPPPERRTA